MIPKSSPPPQQAAKNRTASAGQAVASPTVQESFFKTVTKRLQLLESNTSLSLQYIEDQSRFLQDALLKMERKQIARDIQQNAWDFVPHMYYGQWFQPSALRNLTGLIGMPELIPFWNVKKG